MIFLSLREEVDKLLSSNALRAARIAKTARANAQARRQVVLAHYGNACNQCGTADALNVVPPVPFRGSAATWALKHGLPPDVRLLCNNCLRPSREQEVEHAATLEDQKMVEWARKRWSGGR